MTSPDAPRRRQRTLYLSATVREQRRLRPLFVALIESVVEEAYARSAATGRPLDPPLLVVLDEAANIAPLPDLDVIASTGAGHGVQLLTVLQDLAQAHDRWGSRPRRHDRQQPPRAHRRGRQRRRADARVRRRGCSAMPRSTRSRRRPASGPALAHLVVDVPAAGAGHAVRRGEARDVPAALRQPPARLDPVPARGTASARCCVSATQTGSSPLVRRRRAAADRWRQPPRRRARFAAASCCSARRLPTARGAVRPASASPALPPALPPLCAVRVEPRGDRLALLGDRAQRARARPRRSWLP